MLGYSKWKIKLLDIVASLVGVDIRIKGVHFGRIDEEACEPEGN